MKGTPVGGMWIKGMVEFADCVASIVANMLSPMEGRSRELCGAILWSVTDSYGRFWLVAGSTWSRNDDGTCAISMIKSHAMTAMQKAIDEFDGDSLVGSCERINIGGNFVGHCRFLIAELSGIWSTPCPEA